MNISTIILYAISIIFLIVSIIKDINKTKLGLKKGIKAFINILPMLVPLFLIVGVVLTFITPEIISSILGKESGILGILLGSIVGSIAFMPPFVTFPLGADLIKSGAGYPQVAALVTTLMGVGIVYLQAEIKFFGTGSTIRRNILAFIAAIIVSIIIGVLM